MTRNWPDADISRLAPVVVLAPGLLTVPGWYEPMEATLRRRGAADVVTARVYPPDWALAAVRDLGPIVTRVGRALLAGCARAEELPASAGAPVMLVGHSGGGIVGRLLTSNAPFSGRTLGASRRIGALVTLGAPNQVGPDSRWGRHLADAGVRFANRHVPGAAFAPATGYVSVGSRLVAGRDDPHDPMARFFRTVYDDVLPQPGVEQVDGDGLVPVASALLPGAQHVILDDAWHGPARRASWYGQDAQVDAWWPAAVGAWRSALVARLEQGPSAG